SMSRSNLMASRSSPVGRISSSQCPECSGARRISERSEIICSQCGLVLDSRKDIEQRRAVSERVRLNVLTARLQEALENCEISQLDGAREILSALWRLRS
ncbi:MAG: TFIIB-type zinc ribbon-containing protein, partial [Methanothrix sp.]